MVFSPRVSSLSHDLGSLLGFGWSLAPPAGSGWWRRVSSGLCSAWVSIRVVQGLLRWASAGSSYEVFGGGGGCCRVLLRQRYLLQLGSYSVVLIFRSLDCPQFWRLRQSGSSSVVPDFWRSVTPAGPALSSVLASSAGRRLRQVGVSGGFLVLRHLRSTGPAASQRMATMVDDSSGGHGSSRSVIPRRFWGWILEGVLLEHRFAPLGSLGAFLCVRGKTCGVLLCFFSCY